MSSSSAQNQPIHKDYHHQSINKFICKTTLKDKLAHEQVSKFIFATNSPFRLERARLVA